ncbi:MAG: TolC family protein [Candidatus Methylomirabilia bacterium]
MKRSLVPIAVGLAVLTLPLTARSEEARETGTLVLTLDQALELAAEQNRDVQKAREYKIQVEARYGEERAAALPRFTLSGAASYSSDASQKGLGPPERTDNYTLKLGVVQPLFTWGQIGAGIRLAGIGRSTAGDRLAGARGTALRDAATAFYDVLLAREFATLATQNLEQRGRHLEEARRRLAAGTATEFDVLAASVAEQNARPETIRTAHLVNAARERLAFVLGVPEREVDVEGSLAASAGAAGPPDYATAFQAAAGNRPELGELRKSRAMSEELVRIARAGNKPRLDLGADLGWHAIDMDGRTGDGGTWSAGLQLTWPVFDGGRTKGAVARTESETRSLGLDEARFLDGLALETRTAVDAVREAAAIVEALGGTVAEAERLVAMAEKGFELGVKVRLDVDDAQLNLIQARAGLARGRRDLLAARVNLRWLTGELSPAPSLKANPKP